jgi:hypothetical protein
MKNLSRRAWLIIGAITLAYVVALIADLSPYVRGPDEWRWARWPDPRWERLWPLVLALVLIALGVRWIDRRAQRETARRWIAIGVALLVVCAPLVQLIALRADKLNPFEALYDRAVDRGANSYFSASLLFDNVDQVLRTYPQLMPQLEVHAQVHPPGLPLLYWLGFKAFAAAPDAAQPVAAWFRQLECNEPDLVQLPDTQSASAVVGMALPLLANMVTVWCVYQLARRRFGWRAGLYGAALWVLVPSAILFPGAWALVYPSLACLTWLLVDVGLARRQVGWFLLAGIVMSVGTFLELGTAALALFLVLYILAHYLIERRNPLRDLRFLLPSVVLAVLGVFSVWIVYQLRFGVSLPQFVAAMYPIHVGYEFNRLTWLFNHPYEFAVFVGLPIFCLAVIAFARSVKQVCRGPERAQVDALSLSLLASLLVLTAVDPARDETARTWMLFMPLAVVVAARFFSADQPQPDRFSWLWGLLTIQVVTMAAVLQVMSTGLLGLPPRDALSALPTQATPIQADFGGTVQLVGYETRREGDRLLVDWYWRNSAPVNHLYAVFNHLNNAQWLTFAAHDGPPQGGQPLMTCWQTSEIYRDTHRLKLPSDLPIGDAYFLEIGLVDSQTGARVPVRNGAGAVADHLEIPVNTLP